MGCKKKHWQLVAALCLAFLFTAACQRTRWESNSAAGVKAFHQGRYADAEKLFLAALEEAEGFGPDDPRLATSVNNLAGLYQAQGKYVKAVRFYKDSLAILEKALGPDHPRVATSLENYAELLRETKREAEAAKLEARAKAIRTKHAQKNPAK